MLYRTSIKSVSENQKLILKNRIIIAIALSFFWFILLLFSLFSSTDVLERIGIVNADEILFLGIIFRIIILLMLLPFLILSYYEINKIYFEEIISITYLRSPTLQKFDKFVKINKIVNKKSFFILTGFMTFAFLLSTIALIVRTILSENSSLENDWNIILFIAMILSLLIWFATAFFLLRKFRINNFRDIFTFFLITFTTTAGFTSIFYISVNQGIGVLFFLLLIVTASDIFAYVGGMYFGKTKISPNISPNKTVEGFLIGLISSVVGGMSVAGLFYYIDTITSDLGNSLLNNGQNLLDSILFGMYSNKPITGTNSIIINDIIVKNAVTFISIFMMATAISLTSSIGDIFFSYIKRAHDIKDYSKILKEHGGILDRFDSLLFSSIFYVICFFIILISLEFLA